jgi:hypothetical protein
MKSGLIKIGRALLFRIETESEPWAWPVALLWLSFCLALLGKVLRFYDLGWPEAAGMLALILGLQALIWRQGRRQFYPEVLAPLLLPFAALGARMGAAFFLHGRELPAALNVLLDPGKPLIIGLAGTLALDAWLVLGFYRQREGLLSRLPLLLAACTLVWQGSAYLRLHTFGVSATDPYAYTQMAVDLAEQQRLTHSFPLYDHLQAMGVPYGAAVHLGYHHPDNPAGLAPSDWAIGQSLLLAPAYRLWGEPGLYLLTPLLALLGTVAAGGLAAELFYNETPSRRRWLATLTMLLSGSSLLLLVNTVVPMADVASLLFSTLAVSAALRSSRSAGRSSAGWAALSGAAWGFAFTTRLTQVLMGLPVLAVLLVGGTRDKPFSRRQIFLAAIAGVGALLLALPELIHQQASFGAFWITPSRELMHFALSSIAPAAARIMGELLAAAEFRFLAPFLLAGAVFLLAEKRPAGLWLLIWIAALVPFHLLYRFLRLRDLMALLPVLVIITAYGMLRLRDLGQWFKARWLRRAFQVGLIAVILFGLLLRGEEIFRITTQPQGFSTFGYLQAEQRAGFAELQRLTDQSSWIGCSLNSGAVDLYSRRIAFRPYVWSDKELLLFMSQETKAGQSLLFLEDSSMMERVITTLGQHYRLSPVVRLALPYYFPDGGSINQPVTLWRLEEATAQ